MSNALARVLQALEQMKKSRAEKALPKNGPTKRVGSGRLVLRLVAEIKQHEVGVMEIVSKHNADNEQNRYARGHYVGMRKAYRNVLAMISNLSSQNSRNEPRHEQR